jgi:hypothetical protein
MASVAERKPPAGRRGGPPARFRILGPAFARAIEHRYGELARGQVAQRLAISLPTLRKLSRGEGMVNQVTIARLERALRAPHLTFAVRASDPTQAVIPSMTALPAGDLDATIRALASNPMLAAFFQQIGTHVHWRTHIHDARRTYRDVVRAPTPWPTTGAYARFAIDAATPGLDLALSFALRGHNQFDLAIDFGLVRIDAGAIAAWELIARRAMTAAGTAATPTFLTWIPGHDHEVLFRSDHPCRLRHVETLAAAAGEALLDGGAAVGFRAMGYFHVAPTAPWGVGP